MAKTHKLIAERLSELLRDELGAYRLPNGAIVPSFAVIPPQLDGSIEIATPGVEMIIYKTPQPKSLEVFTGGVENCYRVLLTQRNKSGDLSNAIALIMDAFDNPDMKTPQLQEEDPRRGLKLEQVVFLLEEDRDWNNADFVAAVRDEFYL